MNNQELLRQRPEIFDNTIISTYTKCPRKLYWFLRGIRADTTPPYFTFGRAWGAFQGSWHTERNQKAALDTARALWTKEMPQEAGDNTLENLIEMIELYTQFYSAPEPWEVVGSEMGFQLPLSKSSSILYAGALDQELIWEPYGTVIKEDKTTGLYIGKTYMAQWDFSTQVTGYHWAGQEILGKEIFGVLMNFASKKRRKDNELRFMRDVQKRSRDALETWRNDTLRICLTIQKEWDTWEWLPLGTRNPSTCAGGPGMSACEYNVLCRMEVPFTQINPLALSGFKEVATWEPWNRLGEDE